MLLEAEEAACKVLKRLYRQALVRIFFVRMISNSFFSLQGKSIPAFGLISKFRINLDFVSLQTHYWRFNSDSIFVMDN